jgi:PAS domain-containing protein
MALPIEDVLSVWRELERVHATLPPDAPERTVVAVEIVQMRAMYRSMTARRTESDARLAAALSAVDDAWKVLQRARDRLGPAADDAPPTGRDAAPRLSTFPAEDEAFELFVRTTERRLRTNGKPLTPEALEAALRTYHTRAIVRARNPLATFGEDVWYVYRDGRAGVRVLDDWWQCDDCAQIVFDRAGTILQADDAACALVGVSPGSLAGRPWRELPRSTPSGDSSASMWQLLETTGSLQSVFDVPMPDGGFRVIEFHCEPTEDPDRFTSRWRAIADIPAHEAVAAGG